MLFKKGEEFLSGKEEKIEDSKGKILGWKTICPFCGKENFCTPSMMGETLCTHKRAMRKYLEIE